LSFDIRPARYSDPDALALVDQVQQEYVARYGGRDRTPVDVGAFEPPLGAFFVGYVQGLPRAIGGWRFRPDVNALGRAVAAEVKRMYVAPAARRTGLARAVLRRLEDSARAAGADVMVLETGLAQPEAIALYQSSGYVGIDAFGYYRDSPSSRYFGKPL
jgi:GNAT superfamily N-acetyltransferase